jgi:hypothetical protein
MTTIPLRVTVLDTWEALDLSVSAETPVAELKRRALAAARVTRPAEGYLVKYRGAEVPEEGTTVAGAGFVPNGSLIVLPRARRPAR